MLTKTRSTQVPGLLGLDESNHSTVTVSSMKKRSSDCSSVSADQSRQSVTFCKTVKAKSTLHYKDYTEEEIEATWYSQSEVQAIRLDAKVAAQEIDRRQQSKEDGEEHDADVDVEICCARGLESRTKRGYGLRFRRRSSVVNLVLLEQERQQVMGDYDPEYIALLYQQSCQPSLIDAQQIAKLDEEQR